MRVGGGVAVFLFACAAIAGPCSGQSFAIRKCVIGNGGGGAAGPSGRLSATAGQSAIGTASAMSHALCSGFWCMTSPPVTDAPESDGVLPLTQGLGPARPNPSSGFFIFPVSLEGTAPVRIHVFDLTGRLVRSVAPKVLGRGTHWVAWDGLDDLGRPVGAGIYFARLTLDRRAVGTARLILLK